MTTHERETKLAVIDMLERAARYISGQTFAEGGVKSVGKVDMTQWGKWYRSVETARDILGGAALEVATDGLTPDGWEHSMATLNKVFERYMRRIVENGGGRYVGIQEVEDRDYDLVLFNHPTIPTTLALTTEEITEAKVRNKLARVDTNLHV
jgi:hypothetical protein